MVQKSMPVKVKAKSASAPRKTRTGRPANAAAASIDIGNALDRLKLSGAANALLEGRRRDLEALVAANKQSYEGLKTLVRRRTEQLKDAIAEWQAVAAVMRTAGPADSIARLDDLAKGAFRMALDNISELAELAARSQSDAFDVVKRRVQENVDEVKALLEAH